MPVGSYETVSYDVSRRSISQSNVHSLVTKSFTVFIFYHAQDFTQRPSIVNEATASSGVLHSFHQYTSLFPVLECATRNVNMLACSPANIMSSVTRRPELKNQSIVQQMKNSSTISVGHDESPGLKRSVECSNCHVFEQGCHIVENLSRKRQITQILFNVSDN